MTDSICTHCCIKIQNLSVNLGSMTVVKDVNLHINCRELIAIIGPNGAGKTTLLRAILGEIRHKGTITSQIAGKPKKRLKIAYVPQKLNFDIDSPISVSDLIASGITRRPVWLGISKNTHAGVMTALSAVSAQDLYDRKIGELSGGELQRVLLAMAIYPLPNMLLLDEPVSNIDAKGLKLFYQMVSDLRRHFDVAVVIVTHDLTGIAEHADRIALMNRSIITDGTPSEVLGNKEVLDLFGLKS